MSAPGLPVTKPTKAIVAAVGSTVTALASGVAAVQLAIEDGSLSADEVGSVTAALVLLGLTVWGVWRTPNRPVEPPTD